MFMITLGKKNLRPVVAIVLVGVVACGAWYAKHYFLGKDADANAITQITTTQDVQTYFTGYGIAIDQATLSADRVQVPTTWDDSFVAFNELVAQSGHDLKEVKGETIEKWVSTIPAQSTGEVTQYAVLLLKENDIAGAYLLEKPSGEVTGLEDAVVAMAELRTNSGADSGNALVPDEGSGGATESAEASADAMEEAEPEITVSLEVALEPNEDGFPVE